MRFLIEASMPVKRFNEEVRDGTAGEKLAQIIEDAKPESVYFCAKDGKRCALLIVNMANASEIPRFAEPWFLYFDASIEVQPVMTPQDLQQAGLDKLAKKWQ